MVEPLEDRLVLDGTAVPQYVIFDPLNGGKTSPPAGALTPAQVTHAYGLDQIKFQGSVNGDGSGQTIVIIDAYDNPRFVDSTDPNYSRSDLHKFCTTFNLPDPPSFTKLDQRGGKNYPSPDPAGRGNASWATELALDVEWAHVIAPKANIVLIETDSNSFADLMIAGGTLARTLPQTSVVSMSFGSSEFPAQTGIDPVWTTPAGHQGITFLASSGDTGTPAGYPAASPNVVSVGGTKLKTTLTGVYVGEKGWGNGGLSLLLGGSGGGLSSVYSQPAYQAGTVTQSSAARGVPDIALVADPASGVAVYDSYNNADGKGNWYQIGGTSLACPCWAGIMSIVNQGRSLVGAATLDGPSETLPALYQLPASDFHDITTGDNGLPAGPGYDLVTGRGTPIGPSLVADLAAAPSGFKVYYPIRYIYDPSTGLYNGDMTITNITSHVINGPFMLQTTGIGGGASFANTNTTFNGQPAYSVSGTLAALASLHVSVSVRNPNHSPTSTFFQGYPVLVLSGNGTAITPSGIALTMADRMATTSFSINNSQEHYNAFVTTQYQTQLGRSPDPNGLAYWTNQMMYGGMTDETVESQFIGSAEYIANHGGPGAGWITGMYQTLLGRTPTTDEVNYWLAVLASGRSTQSIAYGFAASDERESQHVRNNYVVLLQRPPEQWEVNYWVSQFRLGVRNEDMAANFVGSDEYMSARETRTDWLNASYLDILHRAAGSDEIDSWVTFIG